MDLRAQIEDHIKELDEALINIEMETNTTNLDLIQKLESVQKEVKELNFEIGIKQERLKALNKLARQYVNLIKAAEALEEQKPEKK